MRNLCLFLPSGSTFTFRGVKVECDNEYALTFSYTAMSDGAAKRATFMKSALAGISTWEGEWKPIPEEPLA